MKVKLAFLAIALIAVTSAFTTAKVLSHKFKVVSFDQTNNRYQLIDNTDIISLQEGTGSGQYSCNSSSDLCTIETNNSAFQSGGVWYVTASESEVLIEGTYEFHN
jgi:hypothetical protein